MATEQNTDRPDSPLADMKGLRATLPVDAVNSLGDNANSKSFSARGGQLSRSASTYSNINGRGYNSSNASANGEARSVIHSAVSNRAMRHSSSRRRSSFTSSFRHQAAAESTAQVEAKFFAFMDMITTASREAITLKELWSRMAAERRDFAAEREELLEQIEEVSTELETRRFEGSNNDNEIGEHKGKLRAMAMELSAAISNLSIEKADRDGAKQDAERYQRELHKTMHERAEITNKFDVASSCLVSLRKEASVAAERLKRYEVDQDEKAQEIVRIKDELRKSRGREEEISQELQTISDKYSYSTREVNKLRDSVRVVETERDELTHTVDVKNREIKTAIARHGETESLLLAKTTEFEHVKRELLITISRDELEGELLTARGKADAAQRQVTLTATMLTQAEQTLSETRSELSTLFGTIKKFEHEKIEWQKKNGVLSDQVIELKGSIVVLRSEIQEAGEMREGLQDELRHSRAELEEVVETITTTDDDSAALEFELESMRTLLREAREQKEQAIAARTTADQERDEAYAKYEEKCRELERFEESASARFHASSSGGSKVSTSTTKKLVSRGSYTE
ncbi:hypothetical protein BDV97DRAFT_372844 [Delphinella strobiligena]|nr:hypothetical protein BDV97DRAFT_372844 [Delphinella strobiligena]